MKLSIGIVGLPNVGKSTLFNALTKKEVPAENYPFCTIDPSVGIVAVEDARLYELSRLSGSKKTIPAAIEFVDIAGLVEGASEGAGLGNKFLSHIREVNAILHLVRLFPLKENGGITHVYGSLDPTRDRHVINLELILADIETVIKRLGNVSRDAKRGDKQAIIEEKLLESVKDALLLEKMARTVTKDFTPEEKKISNQWQLLTDKSIMYGFNIKTGDQNYPETNPSEFNTLCDEIKNEGAEYVFFDAQNERELSSFEETEKQMMKTDLGMNDGINELINAGYKLLGLETYFTTGVEETRAWTIYKNSTAPEAGCAIHNDFKDKFIRAQVIAFKDFIAGGTRAACRDNGTLRVEGKEYIVKDGDVIEFMV